MAIVTVKNKFQVVIPLHVREAIGVSVGDLFEAKAEKGRIIFEPKSLVDRGIAESIAEFKAGHSLGPFATHEEFLAALHTGENDKGAKRMAVRKPKR